jgi:hypothetical protein
VTSSNSAVVFVDTTTNTLQGRAPGTATITVTNRAGTGGIKTATTTVTVSAGQFTGVKPATLPSAGLVSLTAGAFPFDADTKVTVNGESVYVVSNTPTTYTFVAPAASGPTAEVVVSNLGADQVASTFTIPVSAGTSATDDFGAEQPLSLTTTGYGAISPEDGDDWYKFTLAVPATITMTLDWVGGGTADTNDIDAYIYTAGGDFIDSDATSCGTSAHPEVCKYTLPAGDYVARVNFYKIPDNMKSLPYKLTIR